ncbi:unnamed protein product [Arabidopsis halleri]
MADPVLQSTTCPHFFQPLLPGFDSYLNIPVTFFLKHVQRSNEQRTANLRSDASDTTWEVKIDGRSRRLTGGWKEFATAHDFRVGDIIVFRHEGDLVFHVTALGPSCCEIQYVQSCNDDNLDDDQEDIRNLPMEQSLKTELEAEPSLDDDDEDDNMGKLLRKKHVNKRIPETEAKCFSSDQSCFVAHVTDSNLRKDSLSLPRKFVRPDGLNKGTNKIVLVNEGARTWTLILKFRDSRRSFYMRGGWRSFCLGNGLKPGDSVTFKLESNNTKTPLLRFSTAESKSVSTKDSSKGKRKKSGESSKEVSSSSVSENRFLTLTVTPASICCGRLYLSRKFISSNKMEKAGGKKITLLDKSGEEWPVTLLMDKRYTRMVLGSGLKEFYNAIGVKEYESVVFELVWEETTTLPMFKFCSKTKT